MTQLSRNQEHFWIQHNFNPKNSALHIPLLYKFSTLDVDAVKYAITQLTSHYSLLRTKFTHSEGKPCQILKDNYKLDEILHIEEFNYEAPLDFEGNEALKFVHQPFDFNNDLVWRVKVYNYKSVSYIFFVFHHIIIDLHSKRIFCKKFEELYNSYLNGNKGVKTSIAITDNYYSYCEWQRNWLNSHDADKQKSKWKDELKDNLNPIQLPFDKSHKFPKIIKKGKRYFFNIEENISKHINTNASENSIKPFVVFLAAYAIVLSKFSNQQNINFGVPFTNRRKQEFADTFGCFINILPIAVSIDNNLSITDLIKQIRTCLLRTHRIQELPFLDLHEINQEKIDGNIFDVGFTFEDRVPLKLEDQYSEQIVVGRDGAQMELFVTMWHNENTYGGFWEFNELNFSLETIKNLNDFFITLCKNVPAIESQSISSINVMSENGIKFINKFNNTEVAIEDRLIMDYMNDQNLKNPQRTAIICGEQQISYKELNSRINQLSNFLVAHNLSKGDVIGIYMDRSIDMVTCMLATMKIGATYLPLDPDFPEDRIIYMLNDSEAKLILTQEVFQEKFNEDIATSVYSSDKDEYLKQSDVFNNSEADMQSAAYILYTSGSTGKPKGVKIHHEALINFLLSMAKTPGFNEHDVLLSTTTISFDISVLELFLPLIKGGSIVLANSKDVLDGRSLIDLIDKYNVNYFQATPGRWNILLQNGWTGKKTMKALVGGEALPAQLINNLIPKVSELWNMYGPTETTVWSTCKKIESSDLPILVGKPIDNTFIKILSEENFELPIGSIGEVCIGGKGVAKGYHKRDELSKEKFIKDQTGDFVYKTGDKGRIRTDLELELFGRMDNQVKIRGYRVEPNEIENIINKITGVNESVVTVHSFSNTDIRLIAFLSTNSEFKETKTSILSIVRKEIPEYMVPSAYYLENEFPRTPNGKIDRKKLKIGQNELKLNDSSESISDNTSFSGIEKNIESIWRKHLKVDTIGFNDNFFDIGGNSLSLLEVARDVNKLFKRQIDIIDFFSHTTIKTMCSLIQSQKSHQSVEEGINIASNKLKNLAAKRRSKK